MTPSPDRRTPRTRPATTRLLAAGTIFAATFLLAAPPAFADCALTDPNCVQSNVSGASGAIEDVTQGTSDAVAGAADQASGTGNHVVDTVKQTLGGTGTDPDPGPGGASSGGSGSGPSGSSGSHRGPSGPGAGGRPVRSPTGVRPEVGLLPGQAVSSGIKIGTIPHQGLFDRLGQQAVHLAKGLAFPALLGVIVVLFVMVQNRIDRRDPKLALAPIAPEVLRFE